MGIIQLIPSPAPALGSTLPGTRQAGVRKPKVSSPALLLPPREQDHHREPRVSQRKQLPASGSTDPITGILGKSSPGFIDR